MKNETTRFKMNANQLKELLTGKTVSIQSINGSNVEFFMEDIGISEIEKICKEAIGEVKENLLR